MKQKRVLVIFFEGLKIFCLNIHKFLLYMAFPVLGQILGLFMVFGITYWFSQNYQDLIVKYPALSEMSTMLIFTIIAVVPGLVVFTKAFWDYLVAYVALNSMTEGYLNTGKVYDFKSHNQVALKKTFSFISLWFLFGIFTFIAVIPIFWVLGLIFFIYFILIFQVFTFENGLSPIGYFRRSFELVKGQFARTFILATILTVFCYGLLTSGVSVVFDYLNWTQGLAKIFENWVYTLPIDGLERFGITPAIIGEHFVTDFIMFLTVGFTLPIRSICWTLWYNNFAGKEEKPQSSKKKTSKKKTAKTFKIEKREIDPEIIRRARLEDDEY